MSPKTIVISLDGATPFLVDRYLSSGALDPNEGLGLLKNQGISAQQNITVTPSLTAPAHIGIATGANAARNDITANSFHLVASPFAQNTSGFAAPIGGYTFMVLQDPQSVKIQPLSPFGLTCRKAVKRL